MPRRRGRPPLSPLRRNLRTSSILLLVPLLLATARVAVAAAAAAAGAAAASGEGPASSARMLRRGLSSPAPRAALALARHCGFLGPGGPGAGAAATRCVWSILAHTYASTLVTPGQPVNQSPSPHPARRIHFPTSGRRTYAAAAEGSDDAGVAPATTTTRRRAKPSREFIGVAKGMDVGRFRAYSADGFVKGGWGPSACSQAVGCKLLNSYRPPHTHYTPSRLRAAPRPGIGVRIHTITRRPPALHGAGHRDELR